MADLRVRAYALAGLVFALDRISKWIIEQRVSMADTYSVIPGFFDIVHSQNKGVAFGLFNDSTSEWRTVILVALSVLALAFVGAMLWQARTMEKLTVAGLALILGGAAGNLFDRVAWGRVTDFLEFYVGNLHWPTFNLADSAIVIGSGLLLIAMLRPNRQTART
ncbi:MAG: signal peptidase II [Acidobacteria bacterium]|nr:signal peptidase II [Acidobacteriota bacterium]